MKKIKFMNSMLYIPDNVFTPRPETELLVNVTLYALHSIKKKGKETQILDVGTGSGNVAISLTKLDKSCKLVTLDVKKEVLEIAKINAQLNGLSNRIEFMQSNLFRDLPKKFENCFDIIVSNPPYVARWEIATTSDVVQNEPRIAIDGGEDGLDFYREICLKASKFLKKGGYLVMEIGYNQALHVKKLLMRNGFTDFELFRDNANIERAIMAKHG